MTTQPIDVPFGEWTPDLPMYKNIGALVAKNVIPQLQSYRSLNSLSSFTNALTGICLGAIWTADNNNVIFNFAGDNANLYQLSGGNVWSTVNGASAPYNASVWEFTKFGERVIATSLADPVQYFDVGTSSNFADLSGSPPQAQRIGVVRDFVVLGDLSAFGPNYIAWSGYNNSEAWTPSLVTQSDRQPLLGRGGKIQRIVPGEYGVIFREHSIFRMDYVGPPIVFQIDEIEPNRGTPSGGSVAWTGEQIFYYGWDGFYHSNGRYSHPISENKTSRWFQQNADTSGLSSMDSAVDRQNSLVLWAFRSTASAPINDRLIIFNWKSNRWSYAELDTEILDEFVSPGFALDDLDTPLPGGIDTDSIPVDSDAFKGGALSIQAFNSSHETALFNGAPLVATIDTKELSGQGNQRLFVNSVRPLVEGQAGATSITVQVGKRDNLQDNPSFAAPRALNSIGEANIRCNSRYQRYRVNISDGFEHATGARSQIKPKGGRR